MSIIYRIEHITIERLHREMKLVSLEQRRQMQCLNLMYRLSKIEMYIREPIANTRGNAKIKFKLMTKCSSKYLGSPLYRGATLWDKLEKSYTGTAQCWTFLEYHFEKLSSI